MAKELETASLGVTVDDETTAELALTPLSTAIGVGELESTGKTKGTEGREDVSFGRSFL